MTEQQRREIRLARTATQLLGDRELIARLDPAAVATLEASLAGAERGRCERQMRGGAVVRVDPDGTVTILPPRTLTSDSLEPVAGLIAEATPNDLVTSEPIWRSAPIRRRLGAALLDLLVYLLIGLLVINPALGAVDLVTVDRQGDTSTATRSAAVLLLLAVNPITYWVGSWRILAGSPGQLALGLRVIDSRSHRRVGVPWLFVRVLVRPLSLLSVVGITRALRDPKRRMWHDVAAGTRVIEHSVKHR